MTQRPTPLTLLLACLAVHGALGTAAEAAVVVTASAPAGEVRTGDDVPVTLYFLNTGPADADVPAAAAELPAVLRSGGRVTAATLRRVGPPPDGPLGAGRFAAVAYALRVPAGVAGPVAIEAAVGGPASAPARAVAVVAAPDGGAAVAPAGGQVGPVGSRTGSAGGGAAAAVPPGAEVLPNKPVAEAGLTEAILTRFSPHEPIYFIAGTDRPNAKFQISFKYQVFNPEGELAKAFWPIAGFRVAYTQTSLWDWEGESAPFRDSSYRPELLWSAPDVRLDSKVVSRVGFQVGLQHESNGRDGPESRSLNVVYARPSVTFGDYDGLFLTVAPKVVAYVADLGDNPDIKDYRGHGELRVIAGQRDGLQAAVAARVGDDWDKGSVQVDLSYPLRKLLGGNVDLYLHAQYFNGFGESLLDYNQSTSKFRLGFSLVR